MDIHDIVGIREIADILNVPHGTVSVWRYRGVLPAPAHRIAASPLWVRSDIEDWAKATGRWKEDT